MYFYCIFLVYSLNCFVDGKKSTKCDEKSMVCIWKQMANKTITQMCGAEGDTKPTTGTAVCLKFKDGKLQCHCTEENCNGHCKPGTWATMMPKMSTKMMSEETKMTKPTVAEEEPAEETRNDEKKDMKVSSDAVCTMATDKMTTMNDKKTNGNGIIVTNGQNGPSTTSKMVEKKTSDSPVTKAAVHVVIGVFILITPFFH